MTNEITTMTEAEAQDFDEATGTRRAPEKMYATSVALVANSSNWRKVVKELIGDEPVSYAEKSKKDTLRRFPIVTILSEDKEALNRVLTKAAEVE